MHVAVTIPNWPDALVQMPDEWLLLSVSNPDTLKVGREAWLAAGRDPARLHTAYRHYGFEYAFSTDWAWNVAHWRAQFWRFVDGTYLERHAPLVRWVLEKNEYGDTRHAQNPHFEPEKVINAQAAAWVWNNEFRGRTVTNPHDGGHGAIPADCRLVLWNGPVGNDIPRAVAETAIAEDCGLGYHDYIKADINAWPENDGRDPGDWQFHSGRWHFMEQAWGLRPVWVFTEASLYWDTSQGWLSPNCIGGDPARLARILRAHYRDLAGTDAYRQGRVVGEALFGTGAGEAFQLYELSTPTLLGLAPMLRDEWRPAPFVGQWTGDDEMADLAQIRADAEAVKAEAAQAKGRLNEVISQANAAIANQNAILAKANAILAEADPGPQPLFWAVTLGAGLALRDAAGNPTHHPVYAPVGSPAGVVEPGTRIPIYAENVTAGPYTRRATITPDGLNVWMRDVPATTYRRE